MSQLSCGLGRGGKLAATVTLIAVGSRPDPSGPSGPLILAAAYGRDEAVAALLEKNADPAVVDRKGTALDYAREYDFDKVVALLKK